MKIRRILALAAAFCLLSAAAFADGAVYNGEESKGPEIRSVLPFSYTTQLEYENPEKLLDNNINTVYEHVCWNSKSTDDIPEISMYFGGVTLKDIWIRNGDQSDEDSYYNYARVKMLRVTVHTREGEEVTYNYTLQDLYDPWSVSSGWNAGYQQVSLPRTFYDVTQVDLWIYGWHIGYDKNQYVARISDVLFSSGGYSYSGWVTPAPTRAPTQVPTQAPTYSGYTGYSGAGIWVTLNQRMATRSGPGTQYTELGSYFKEGQNVTALSAAWDDRNGIWWIQTEFSYGGEKRRAYTGLKRLNMLVSQVPVEFIIETDVVLSRSVYAYYGPGYGYTMYQQRIPAGTTGTVWQEEGGYSQLEFYDEEMGMTRRVWVPSSALEAMNG